MHSGSKCLNLVFRVPRLEKKNNLLGKNLAVDQGLNRVKKVEFNTVIGIPLDSKRNVVTFQICPNSNKREDIR